MSVWSDLSTTNVQCHQKGDKAEIVDVGLPGQGVSHNLI